VTQFSGTAKNCFGSSIRRCFCAAELAAADILRNRIAIKSAHGRVIAFGGCRRCNVSARRASGGRAKNE
jgi:hypothetical protein